MMCLIDLFPLDCCGVGARINISKCRSSHQNGSESPVVLEEMMAAMICERV